MPDTTPDNQKASVGSSFAARAAAVAAGVSVALLLALYVVATLPDKSQDWRAALPTPAMAGKDAEAAFLRARYLHEAAVRPLLIQAGFVSPEDAARKRAHYSGHTPAPAISESLTSALWSMRTLPELHDAFLAGLLDTKTAPHERAESFYRYAAFLSAVGDSIAHGRASGGAGFHSRINLDDTDHLARMEREWFGCFANDPRPGYSLMHGGFPCQEKGENADAACEAKLAFARDILPVILASVMRETDRQAAPAAEDAREGQNDPRSNARNNRLSSEDYFSNLEHDVNEAVVAMWEHRGVPGFLAQAKEMLLEENASFAERCGAVPLIAEKPGLPAAEYLFWLRHKSDLASVTSCIGASPVSYAYLLGCMGKLATATTDRMKANGAVILDGHQGAGVMMTRMENFMPSGNLNGNLYLLADMELAMKDAPAYDLSRAVPIFRGMLYRHMENQPVVLPLNPRNPADKALLDWYNEKGWTLGRMVLFSAVGTPADVAGHWGGIHLAWWDNGGEKTEPDLAFLHPVSGHFMTGLLPVLKGEAASRFLGPVTGLWFGRWNVDANGWVAEKYEARPEAPPAAPATARKTPLRSPIFEWLSGGERKTAPAATPLSDALPDALPSILISEGVRESLGDAYRHNYRVSVARRMDSKFKDESMTPPDVFAFVDNAVSMLAGWGVVNAKDVAPATEYLWQYRNEPETAKRIQSILADDSLRSHERLCKIRRALGLPEKKGN